MLSDKAEALRLSKQKLYLMENDLPIANVQDRIRSALEYGYAQDTKELGLYVCGQSTGEQ
jgi:NH3-dependent NAD+ synthetase